MARSTLDVPQSLRRIAARTVRHTAGGLVCAAALGWCAPVVHAQDAGAAAAGGAIVIPGPGEKNSAELARMTALANAPAGSTPRSTSPAANLAATLNQPAASSATSPANERFSALASASGAIVIPGPGEPAARAANGVPQMITSPATPAMGGVVRINTLNAPMNARAAMPVAVNPAQPAMAPAVEIDSLASRGEPPELAASGAYMSAAPISARPAARIARPGQPTVAELQAVQAAPTTTAQPAMRAALGNPGNAGNPRTQGASASLAVRPVQAGQPESPAQAAQAAQPVPAGQEDGELIRAAALAFLKQQATGLPGDVELSVAPAFPRGLAACSTLQPFMPAGARLWGHTTIGVRCAAEHPWTVWLQAKVSVHATYYAAAHALTPGDVLSASDLVARDGDLTMLPQAIVTDPAQAVGSTALMRVGAGIPLRQDMLRNPASVTAGQTVRVIAQGSGFSISVEGSALSNATPGQPVKVKTSGGQIIMGVVKDASTVMIQM